MSERQVLVVDHDAKNLKLFEGYFSEAHFRVHTAVNDGDALKYLERNVYDVVVCELHAPGIDGFRLLKEIQRDAPRSAAAVVFLSAKSDVWNRVKSLKLGAKDYIVKPVHVREIVARVKMILQRTAGRREGEVPEANIFSGRLEDLSVIDLIEIFGIEKKTGVLTLINENGFGGQIVFNRGCVFSANTGALRAEEAVYKLMAWNRGRFTMLFGDVDAEDEMMISNMGMLLQGAKRMDLRNELLKQLPSLDAVVITTSNFKKILAQKEMNPELKEFLVLFDGERTLGRIIDDCRENEIITLKRIVKLYKLGFLHVLRDFAREEQPVQFKSDMAEELFEDDAGEADAQERVVWENVRPKNNGKRPAEVSMPQPLVSEPSQPKMTLPVGRQTGTLLVIGADEEYGRQFVEALTAETSVADRVGRFDFRRTHLYFKSGDYLNIVGVSVGRDFSPLIDLLRDLVGIVVVVGRRALNWGYYRYLLNALRLKAALPVHVVYESDAFNELDLSEIRAKLGIVEAETLHVQSSFEPLMLRRLLFVMLKSHPSASVAAVFENAEVRTP